MIVSILLRHRAAAVARRVALLALGALALAACADTPPDVACPEVRVDSDTSRLVKFREGPGRDLTDVVYEARISGFAGDCGPSETPGMVNVRMKVAFAVSKGPAYGGGTNQFTYFVAVPAYYPAPSAKQVFPVSFSFPEGNVTTMFLRDEAVTVDVPVPAEGGAPPVYVGFQLTAEELEYNRRTKR